MNNRGLIIAAAVLALLLGFLYWSNRHPRSENTNSASSPTNEPAPEILTLNEGDITKIELKKSGADQIVIARDSNGKWQITSPKAMGVDDSAISGMLSSLSSLHSDRVVEEKPANLERYGLTKPKLEIDITDKNNHTSKLSIGDDTPTSSGAYVQLAGNPRVFTVASYVKTGLDKGVNDLRDKRLITADADKIIRLELITKEQTIEFSRDKEQWQILKPKPLRADGAKVDELVRKITGAQMDLGSGASETPSPSPSPSANANKTGDKTSAKGEKTASVETNAVSAFASGSVIATARVATDSTTQQIEVRKNKDDYYAKSSVTDGVFKVASDLGEALDKKLDDFRNKKPFDIGFEDPGKIEIHAGAKTYFLTKGGEDWWSAEGKKYDRSGVDALISKLRDLNASEFAESGFGDATLRISVTSNDGKHSDTVSLTKGSKNTLARREGETSLYVLDENVLGDIEKLLNELKS